jgi:hypothetical protein
MHRLLVILLWLAAVNPAHGQWEPERTRCFLDIVVPAGHRVEAATCFFCSVRVEGELRDDAVAQWGDVIVSGAVGGDAVAIGGNVRLHEAASVKGDIVAVGGDATLSPGAHSQGDVVASMGSAVIAPGATIAHDVSGSPLPLISRLPARLRIVVVIWLIGLAISLPLAFLSLFILRVPRLERLLATMRIRRLRTLLFGALLLAALIVALEVGGESNYADWLELPLCLFLAILAAPGYAALSLRLGKRWARRSSLALLLGTIALVTAQSIPIVGWLLFVVLLTFALGALLSSIGLNRYLQVRESPTPARADVGHKS